MQLVSILADNSLSNRFDDVWSEKDFWADKYPLSDTKDFVSFVLHTPMMRETKYLIIDLSENETAYSIENILQGIHRLQSFTTTRPIFVLSEGAISFELATALVDIGIKNIIYVNDKNNVELLDEMRECLSEYGKGFADSAITSLTNNLQQIAIAATQIKITLPKDKILQIAVAGVKPHVGVSTQCITISNYLYEIGLKPLIITFDTIFYEKLKLCFELKENILNVLEIEDTHLSLNIPTTNTYNAIIYDFGKLSESDTKAFKKADIPIILSTARAWDLGDLNKALTMVDTFPHLLWLNFTNKNEVNGLTGWTKLEKSTLARLPFIPDPFKTDNEISFYHTHLLPYIKKVANNEPNI